MKKYFFSLALLCLSLGAVAQEKDEGNNGVNWAALKDKVYFGGNVGGRPFGDPIFLDASPLMGYRVTDRFSAGIGVTYRYTKFNALDYVDHLYGGRFFARFMINERLFAYTEYEGLNYEQAVGSGGSNRVWDPAFFVGGGGLLPVFRGAGLMVTALYNLSWDRQEDIYAQPYVVRVGFVF